MTSWKWLAGIACAALMSGTGGARSAENRFPFDSELILDVDPMRGSKRIPNMDVAANGAIALEMWCNRIVGQVIVAADTITVLTGQATERPCSPEQSRRDAELMAALTGVTNWRRDGSILSLIGPQTLRFRVPTN